MLYLALPPTVPVKTISRGAAGRKHFRYTKVYPGSFECVRGALQRFGCFLTSTYKPKRSPIRRQGDRQW